MYKAQTRVHTDKASRYLKALCNHFDRKATATYDDNHGTVQFEFGHCEMVAIDSALAIHVSADTEELFGRVKYVVADHLQRFAEKESITVVWNEHTDELT